MPAPGACLPHADPWGASSLAEDGQAAGRFLDARSTPWLSASDSRQRHTVGFRELSSVFHLSDPETSDLVLLFQHSRAPSRAVRTPHEWRVRCALPRQATQSADAGGVDAVPGRCGLHPARRRLWLAECTNLAPPQWNLVHFILKSSLFPSRSVHSVQKQLLWRPTPRRALAGFADEVQQGPRPLRVPS